MKAQEKICADLSKQVIRELRKTEGGAVVDGIELHISNKVSRTYAPDIQACLDELNFKIDEQKKIAEDACKVTQKTIPFVKGFIPKATAKQVLARVSDYAKHFGIKS
jgi:hypothetical protein